MSNAVSLELGPVLITGAARRIGLAVAQRFALEGRPVVIHSSKRSLTEAKAAAEAIRSSGGRAEALDADLSNVDETRTLVARSEQAFGAITLLVNNASLFTPDAAGDFPLELYERHFAINLRAPLLLSQEMAARLPSGADGAIVNIVDQRVWRLTPRYFSYTLSKSALWTATQTMAQAFAPHIRVNAVGPGPVLPNTAFGDKGFTQETHGVPLQHAVSIESVVDAVSYVAKARCVTGQMIAVDSGQHLSWQTPDVLPEE
jgi:NAD(P)-dependent dehydrogenase (short-subunit alcohol dehydrogenase family)